MGSASRSLRQRHLLDVWFVMCAGMAVGLFLCFAAAAWLAVPERLTQILPSVLTILLLLSLFAWVASSVWCWLKIDHLDSGWRKFLWQVLAYVGPTVCYFIHLRGCDLHDFLRPSAPAGR